MARNQDEGFDWIELAAWAGKLVGLSPVRIRWKLRAWRDRARAKGRTVGQKAALVSRDDKLCPTCGAINAGADKTCVVCGARLRSRVAEKLERFLRHFSLGLTPETFLVGTYVLIYAVTVFRGPGSGWLWSDGGDLFHLGGNFGPITLAGEPWRLLTAILLHGGLAHLGFNAYATLYIMPFVRQVYGSNKAMFVFAVSGIGSSLASIAWSIGRGQQGGVSIGASGAICGLIGLILVWGHREGTMHGVEARNAMARWVAYTLLFGFMAGGIDNAAHVGGWILGGLMALLIPSRLIAREAKVWKALGLAASLLVVAAAAIILCLAFLVPFPPRTP